MRANWPPLWNALHGYLTLPGLVLAGLGAVVGARRHRAAAALLAVWTVAVYVAFVLLALWAYPRYFATAILPAFGLRRTGALAVWDFPRAGLMGAPQHADRSGRGDRGARTCCPPPRFEARVLADPVTRALSRPRPRPVRHRDERADVARGRNTRAIERRGGPYPVYIDVALGYP